ncbi:hypothetical protein CKA49_38015, partial [Pseudomonas aeruginosa]
LYGVLTKRWSISLPNWQSLYVQVGFGVLLLLPNFFMAESVALNKDNIGLVIFAGIGASILAPYLWILGVMKLGANTTSIFMNLMPLFTAIIAITFLGEELHSYHLVGPYMVTRAMASGVSACLATPFKIKGVNYSISSACSTSAHCIGHAVELIQLVKHRWWW